MEGTIPDKVALHQRCAEHHFWENFESVIFIRKYIFARLNNFHRFSQARNGQLVPYKEGF